MSYPQITNPKAQSQLHWPSLIQFVLSALAAFLILGAAVIIVVTSAAQFFIPGSTKSEPYTIFYGRSQPGFRRGVSPAFGMVCLEAHRIS